MKDRVVIEGNSMQVRGEPKSLWVKDRVATDARAARRSEMNCEPSLIHILWFGGSVVYPSNFYSGSNSWQLSYHSDTALTTLLLHGYERVRLVTLLYCCLQEEKTGHVRITLYWGAFVLTLGGFAISRRPLKSGAISWMWEKSKAWRISCNFGSAGKISLTINIAISERITEFSAVVRT